MDPMSAECADAINALKEWLSARVDDEAERSIVAFPLYHYTSAASLLGIIKNQEIWFTGLFHLNDPSELDYGMKLAGEIMRKRRKAQIKEEITDFVEGVTWGLNSRIYNYLTGQYVACFSREGDDLGQWRAYGDNGRGFALGLAPSIFRQPMDIFRVAEVNYRETNAIRLLKEPIERILGLIGSFRLTEDDQGYHELYSELNSIIVWYALHTKHKAYAHEKETRLIIHNAIEKLSDVIQTRVRGSSLVPYIPQHFPVKSLGNIHEIVIGPAADPDAREALHVFLSSQGLSGIDIRKSEIPYRVG